MSDPITNITFKADELRRLLHNASLFACTDDTLPAICAVRFEWEKNRLFAVATDRYMLSWEEAFPVQSKGHGGFSVSTQGDVKRILAILPAKAKCFDAQEVTVEYDAEARNATVTFDGNTVRVGTDFGEFPKWRRFSEGFVYDARDGITFNPKFLAKFAKVEYDGDRHPAVTLAFQAGNKPAMATMGDRFSCIVIPIKAGQTARTLPLPPPPPPPVLPVNGYRPGE